MKKSLKKIFNIVIYISFIISIIGHIIINRNNILNNNTKTLKEMSESTQISDLNKTIEQLNSSHTEYANQIQTSKQKIANSINMYPNNNATENNSLEELSTMITNLTNVPENTYYYESGTEGDSSTIVRYKKIDGKYYICDTNGVVTEGTSATDVSTLTLIPYSATMANNLSAGSAGYTSGKFYLGDGSDNSAYNDIIYGGVITPGIGGVVTINYSRNYSTIIYMTASNTAGQMSCTIHKLNSDVCYKYTNTNLPTIYEMKVGDSKTLGILEKTDTTLTIQAYNANPLIWFYLN